MCKLSRGRVPSTRCTRNLNPVWGEKQCECNLWQFAAIPRSTWLFEYLLYLLYTMYLRHTVWCEVSLSWFTCLGSAASTVRNWWGLVPELVLGSRLHPAAISNCLYWVLRTWGSLHCRQNNVRWTQIFPERWGNHCNSSIRVRYLVHTLRLLFIFFRFFHWKKENYLHLESPSAYDVK